MNLLFIGCILALITGIIIHKIQKDTYARKLKEYRKAEQAPYKQVPQIWVLLSPQEVQNFKNNDPNKHKSSIIGNNDIPRMLKSLEKDFNYNPNDEKDKRFKLNG